MTEPVNSAPDKTKSKRERPQKNAAPNVESRTRSRGRPAIIGVSIAIILLSALGVGYLVQSAGQTRSVFVSATELERGDVVTASDLTTIEVPKSEVVEAFGGEEADSLIGQYLTTALPKGSLMGPAVIAASAPVDKGTSIVGVALTPAQLPPYPLVAGDSVRIIETPISQGDPPATTPKAIPAKIVKVSAANDEQGGSAIVAVVVDKDQAADLAARAATGRVALVLDSDE